MRAFVAGASGALASRLVPQLISAGHEVLGAHNSPATAERLRQLVAKPVAVDLLDARAVGNAVLDSQPDAIVHLDAAKPAVRESLGALRRVTLVTLATRPASKPLQQRTMSFGPTRSHGRSTQSSGAGPLAWKGDSE
jgi:uncharacterized protein YbjT (DUF2867 family)